MNTHIAQLNIGTMLAPTDDPSVAEFMENLDRINEMAESSAGFVWRLQSDAGNATDIQIFPNPLQLVNMSVWESVAALKEYTYKSGHVDFFRRRSEWFERDARRLALWAVAAAQTPELRDAVRRVEFRERHGSTAYAFGFNDTFEPLTFEPTSPDDVDTLELIGRLNDELTSVATHPGENHFTLHAEQVTGANGKMLRARLGDRLVGCAAVRKIESGVGEIKRMFVDPIVRGQKLGAAILDQIELAAHAMHLTEVKLETGPNQPEALGLYASAGFERCEAWGEYLDSPATSMCFRKPLPKSTMSSARP